MAAFVSPELAQTMTPQFGESAPRQVVGTASVALGGHRALITVAASVSLPDAVTRYLAVPLTRDGDGGLVVEDLPSLVAAPLQAQPAELDSEEPGP